MYSRNPFTAWHHAAPHTVLIPVDRKDGAVLNNTLVLKGSGPFLWDLLEKPTSSQDLVEAILAEYEIDQATAHKDVERFLQTLLEWKAICSSDDSEQED